MILDRQEDIGIDIESRSKLVASLPDSSRVKWLKDIGDCVWIIEADPSRPPQRGASETHRRALRLYEYDGASIWLIGEATYPTGSLRGGGPNKADLVMDLLSRGNGQGERTVIASHRCGGGLTLARRFNGAGYRFVLEIPDNDYVKFLGPGRPPKKPSPKAKFSSVHWCSVDPRAPVSGAEYTGAEIGRIDYGGVRPLRCYAMASGGIRAYSRSTLVGITNLSERWSVEHLTHLLGWSRWLRPMVRRSEKLDGQQAGDRSPPTKQTASGAPHLEVKVRPNRRIAEKLDEGMCRVQQESLFGAKGALGGFLRAEARPLNVIELFAGAGGMGLGFLLARGGGSYRILSSIDVHPVYAHTLRRNHSHMRRLGMIADGVVPESVRPLDLRSAEALRVVLDASRRAGGADILIGGPPCQGFSNANRNSWSADNPNNRLVDTFIDYVEALKPRVFLMENVQGILWTPRQEAGQRKLSVADHVARRLSAAGYDIFAKLLDAAWFGVAQHRNRFFLLGIRSDIGYEAEDFGDWGPFPVPEYGPGLGTPFQTVRDAIADLPPVGNGARNPEIPYEDAGRKEGAVAAFFRRGAPEDVIWDHVTSRHADYVIERYRLIPPGGNWQDVEHMMTNYANVERTHSNIYRRLEWDEPSITIGHYRKSMIIHPEQDRGLSLREAARLQSFPDWFRFAGSPDRVEGGLTHKQQQLANAVCPLVTRAVAEFLLRL